jgi:uncharacterized DUF497 family protein
MKTPSFEWDEDKDLENRIKHGVSFAEAQHAFYDPERIIRRDLEHSAVEQRYFCFGRVGDRIMTVRFTVRGERIRIYGAGYWRKGKKTYEEDNRKKRH